ncbi:integration host factor subunit beta [Brevinema andersonii]|uniref:Integration host factor subunit beta n=1 Tax=Brevinema andersonii TaxID=34097 RepID=A0A1I1CYI1_BREAD|nr:HU family DNA-binding protein [Brevinema andersonii]SFB67809.1 integration host factor subunit beta [Brevinema andersonii]
MGKSKLTKSDIVDILCGDGEIIESRASKHQIALVISKFIETLRKEIEKLNNNERIELRGFGTFGIRQRKDRIARNPKTNEHVNVPARKSPYFKAGRYLRSIDNN